jgi:hypothetical protein
LRWCVLLLVGGWIFKTENGWNVITMDNYMTTAGILQRRT